jgi:hypothetical protein
MDFIGIIIKQQYIDTAIFDYFGGVIIRSHEKLESLLLVSRNNNPARFIHYTYLCNAALNRKQDFENECESMLKQIEKDKQKRKDCDERYETFYKIKQRFYSYYDSLQRVFHAVEQYRKR